jgi:hypothetical protein
MYGSDCEISTNHETPAAALRPALHQERPARSAPPGGTSRCATAPYGARTTVIRPRIRWWIVHR